MQMQKEVTKMTKEEVTQWIAKDLKLEINEEAWHNMDIDGTILECVDEILLKVLGVDEKDWPIIIQNIEERL